MAKPAPKKNVPPNRAHDTNRSGGQGETPIRTVRVDDQTWGAAKRKSKSSGTTMSNVMVSALKHFVGK